LESYVSISLLICRLLMHHIPWKIQYLLGEFWEWITRRPFIT
jgi:hypothetical protein